MKPISLLTETIDRDASSESSGETDIRQAPARDIASARYEARGDEIGSLARALERLRQRTLEVRCLNERFDGALANLPQGLCVFDADNRLVVSNARYGEMYGLSPEQSLPGATLAGMLEHRIAAGSSPKDGERYLAEGLAYAGRGESFHRVDHLQDGRAIAIRSQRMPGGGWIATHEDITERLSAEAQIAHMAHHDALTGLPNRVLLRQDMTRGAQRAARGEQLAVLCLDLDHFKPVNDTLGHPVGDALLKAVADRLRDCVRETDTVARLGGDEFAIVQMGGKQPNDATALSRRLIEKISAPYDIDGHNVVIGTSVGISVAPHDGTQPDQLLKNADMALYRAKSEGRGTYRFFESAMDAKMQARRMLELDLRRALVEEEFELHYQPIMEMKTGEIKGFEALLRWNHPTRGRVSPDEFIPLSEEVGLIVPLGTWVLRKACAEAAKWPQHISVAINISPVQFRNRKLALDVVAALGASGLSASRLEIEVTESALLLNTEATLATLHELRDLGVRISMDDFGTGYSSLNYLRKFPFDKLKIDRSFVGDLTQKGESLAIVRAVANLGASLGITTTAEGVETLEQLNMLQDEECTEVQGYLFSVPVAAGDIPKLMQRLGDGKRKIAV